MRRRALFAGIGALLATLASYLALDAPGMRPLVARLAYGLPPPPPEIPIGQPLPDVEAVDQDGRPLRLSSLRGQPVLLVVFLGGWCPYCREQLTALAAEAGKFPADSPRIVAVTTDSPEALARLRRRLALPFTLLSDPDHKLVPVCSVSMHCLVALDDRLKIRWGAFNENWRTPPRYRDVLSLVSGLKGLGEGDLPKEGGLDMRSERARAQVR